MASKPLEVLRKGLKVFKTRAKTKKEILQAQLAEKKSISSQDERWLDHDANLVDEQQVLEALENASDYERAFERLDGEQKGVVRKLCEAAGDPSKVIGSKRKRPERTRSQPNKKDESPAPVLAKKEDATLAQRTKTLDRDCGDDRDDVEDSDDAPVEPCPTYQLRATFVIERYTNLINDPLARELEAALASFRWQMHLETRRSRSSTITRD
ncbi:hypothetical protein BJV78DRAFT_1156442 [Lactifluus subvellereus]|nr:hypothetical protein BJV78DRAFT_1156442 [Lactifluus subvellereus]